MHSKINVFIVLVDTQYEMQVELTCKCHYVVG